MEIARVTQEYVLVFGTGGFLMFILWKYTWKSCDSRLYAQRIVGDNRCFVELSHQSSGVVLEVDRREKPHESPKKTLGFPGSNPWFTISDLVYLRIHFKKEKYLTMVNIF